MGRLFGTDGVRGIANKELTSEIAMQLGRAIAMVIGRGRNNKYGTVDTKSAVPFVHYTLFSSKSIIIFSLVGVSFVSFTPAASNILFDARVDIVSAYLSER